MSNVSEWSTTAGSNNSAPPDGAPENMLPGKVNDCMREMMAALAKWFQDSNGSLTSAGGTTAYTLTTNSVHAALSDIPLLVFKVNATNTGTVTLNVDGLGAKPWRKSAALENYASGELVINQTVVVAYNSTEDDFFTVGPVTDGFFAAGVDMVFYEATAPTGWTAVSQNDKALRVVTQAAGTGGSAGGTTAFSSVFTSRTILQANLPSYNLSAASLTGSVSTTLTNGSSVIHGTSGTEVEGGGGPERAVSDLTSSTVSLASGTVTFGGSIPSGGSGTAMDFAVQYVNVIIATKD